MYNKARWGSHAILLTLLLLATLCSANQKTSLLRPVLKCPSEASLAALSPVDFAHDLFDCTVACVGSNLCSGVHFSKVNGKCYHGNSLQLSSVWDRISTDPTDGCVTYVKSDDDSTNSASTKTGALTSPTSATNLTHVSVISGLRSALANKLVILFDFRQGYSNLANPAKYPATPHGSVTRNNQGAHFPGNKADFIEVDTDSNTLASAYLDHSHNFTFYARAVRQTYSKQYYHQFYDCNNKVQGWFAEDEGKLFVKHAYSGQSTVDKETETIWSLATDLLNKDNTPQDMAAAAVFNGIHFSKFYFNGSATAGGSDMNYSFKGAPQCLRLGFDVNSANALNGRLICYAIAKAALEAEEIKELDSFCGY